MGDGLYLVGLVHGRVVAVDPCYSWARLTGARTQSTRHIVNLSFPSDPFQMGSSPLLVDT